MPRLGSSLEGACAHELSIQYRVLPITKQNVLQGFETLTNPQNLASSPFGWHSDGRTNTTNTSYAQPLPPASVFVSFPP